MIAALRGCRCQKAATESGDYAIESARPHPIAGRTYRGCDALRRCCGRRVMGEWGRERFFALLSMTMWRWGRPRRSFQEEATGVPHRVWMTGNQPGQGPWLPRPAPMPDVPLAFSREHSFFCCQGAWDVGFRVGGGGGGLSRMRAIARHRSVRYDRW